MGDNLRGMPVLRRGASVLQAVLRRLPLVNTVKEQTQQASNPVTSSSHEARGQDETTTEPPNALSREESIALVESFPFWYQRIYLGNGVYTLPQRAYHE